MQSMAEMILEVISNTIFPYRHILIKSLSTYNFGVIIFTLVPRFPLDDSADGTLALVQAVFLFSHLLVSLSDSYVDEGLNLESLDSLRT